MKLFKYIVQDAFNIASFSYGVLRARDIQAAVGELDQVRTAVPIIGTKQNLALQELIDRKTPGPLLEVNDPLKLWAWWKNDVPMSETLVFEPCGVLSVGAIRRFARLGVK